jgi:hypothetical protein
MEEKAEKKSSEAVDFAAGSGQNLLLLNILYDLYKTHIRNQAKQLINLLAGQRIVEAWITVIKLIIAADTIFGIRRVSKESQENIALLCLVINF